MKDVLYDGPFKIYQYNNRGSLTFATVVYGGQEINIRFRYKNLQKVIEYIRTRYWEKGFVINPENGEKEVWPLKQHLKSSPRGLFLW